MQDAQSVKPFALRHEFAEQRLRLHHRVVQPQSACRRQPGYRVLNSRQFAFV